MANNKLSFKEIALVLVSAVLGGLISLFIYVLYQEDNKIFTDPSLGIIFVILIQAVKYLFFIGIILFFAYLFFKFINLYFDVSNDSMSRLLNWILKKLKLEHIKNIEIIPDLGKIYENNKDLFNFIILVAFLVFWVYNYNLIQNFLGWVNYLIIFITIYTAIDRLILYIKSKINKK